MERTALLHGCPHSRASLSRASPAADNGAWPKEVQFEAPGGAAGRGRPEERVALAEGASHGGTLGTRRRRVTGVDITDRLRQPETFHVKHRGCTARPGRMRLRCAEASSFVTGRQRAGDRR